MTPLKILFAAALIGIGAGWAFYWFAMSVFTTDTDTVNSLTWRGVRHRSARRTASGGRHLSAVSSMTQLERSASIARTVLST